MNSRKYLLTTVLVIAPVCAMADHAGAKPVPETLSTSGLTPHTQGQAQVGIGPISPITGFPVPPGFKVAWEDGRLNPQRGPKLLVDAE
ncbi:MAG: hypothetical protein AAF667_06335 [Pseudomonadota bacterium]